MEKVRPWCGQPSDRGRLRNRTEQSGEIVRTNMKRVCGFAISHIATHYYATLH